MDFYSNKILGLDLEILVVCVILLLLLYFILSRTVFRKKKKATKYSIISTIIASPLIFYISIVSILFFKLLVPDFQKEFDQKAWDKSKFERFEMRDDIVESKMLQNLKSNEVLELLGHPDQKDSIGNWVYDLGTSGAGFGWQFNYLKVKFNNDRVEESELIEVID